MAIVNGLAQVVLDIERFRAQQRDQREAAIREAAERQERGIARLRGVMRGNDRIFGASAASAPAKAADMSRGEVFAALRGGAAADGLPAEFVRDYENSKQPWW